MPSNSSLKQLDYLTTGTPSPIYPDSTPQQQHPQPQQAPSLIKISQPFVSSAQIKQLLEKNESSQMLFFAAKSNAFELIMRASITFRFPVKTICSAMLIFQHFYLFNKINSHSIVDVISACLLVASKIEDTPKRSKEFISYLHVYKGTNLSLKQLDDKKNLIITIEREIFETIGFDFRHISVQYFLIKICKEIEADKDVAKVAWTISVDSLLSNVYLEIPSHTIALACIILARKILKETRLSPIESAVYCSTRYKANVAMLQMCDLYLDRECKFIELKNHPDYYSLFHKRFTDTRAGIRKEMRRFLDRNAKSALSSERIVQQRDPKISHVGAVRYVLEWDRDSLTGELKTHVGSPAPSPYTSSTLSSSIPAAQPTQHTQHNST